MAKIFRLCLLLVFILPPARANEALRAVLADVKCPATKFNVRDGRELADALERTLRQSPGGEDLCVTWIDRAAPPFAGDSWSAELTALPARDLLRTVCANAGVFWGFRHGGIALSSRPLRVSEYHPYMNVSGCFCGSRADDSSLRYPETGTAYVDRFKPAGGWRVGQEPSFMLVDRARCLALRMAEDDLIALPKAYKTDFAGSSMVLISATWISVPASSSAASAASLDGEELRRLLREGKARVRHHQSVSTFSGINAVVEAVEEIRYPCEFDVAAAVASPFGSSPVLAPLEIETRETGFILNVTPTVNEDHVIINFQLMPEWIQQFGWQTLGQRPPPENRHHQAMPRMPCFQSWNTTTSLTGRDNGQLVLEMGRDSRTGDSLYLQLHARLLNEDGTPRNP